MSKKTKKVEDFEVEVKTKKNHTEEEVIYTSADKILRQNIKTAGLEEILDSFSYSSSSGSLTINFITPTRLKFEGRLSGTLEFHIARVCRHPILCRAEREAPSRAGGVKATERLPPEPVIPRGP